MNAMLNIQVRVLGQQAAAQIKAMQGQLNQLQKQTARSNVAAGAFNSTLGRMNGLEKFGKNLQWTGRQLEYNFTLPLVIAGAMSTKWALENEKAMVRVRKVYGDLNEDVGDELKALEKSFQLLSNRFGVHLKEVTDIGAAWAQAGAAGVGLAKATRLTLEAMIIGEMEATEATEGLIAVQSAYRFNTNELRDAMADLNIVENQTAVGFSDLIEIITRAGGAARTAGISHEYLAAMSASLVPATGSAARAGASLRTIFSRLLAPTRQASELLKEIGIDVHDVSWVASNGVKRIEMLSKAFMGLTQSQQAIVSSTVASRWQINRFDTLMRDVFLSLDAATRGQSAYGRALDATSDQQRANAIYARELATVLSSSPRAFQILTTNIKNAMAEAILPLLPVLISLLNSVRGLVVGFNNLSPEMQNLALSGLFLLAVIGPLGRYVGSFILLGTTLGHAFHFAGKGVMFFGTSVLTVLGWILTPFKIAFQAVVGVASIAFGLMAKAMSGAFVVMGGLTSRFLSFFIGAMRMGFIAAVSGIHTVLVGGLTPALAGAAAALGRTMAAMSLMVTRTATVIHTAWGLAIAGIGRLMVSLPLIAAAVSRGLALTFTAAAAASQGAWVIFQRFIATMPIITAVIWQGIKRVWVAGYAALRLLTIGFHAFMAVASAAVAAVMAAPIAAAVIAIVALVSGLAYYFRSEVVGGIIKAFQMLPAGIQQTLMSVLRMVKQFALAVYKWLSYLNPFARHSPSLVDNVTAGVTAILNQYSRLNGVKAVISEAIAAHRAFLSATGAASRNFQMEEFRQKKADIVAVSPGAGPAVDRLIGSIMKMKGALASVNVELQAQQRLVNTLERDLATAMKPYNDAIFKNEMAQKKLRLEILKMKQAGQSVDDLKRRYALLAGEIEKLRGNREELRLAGAGSDVLGVYDQQLKGLESQRNAMEGMTSPIDDLQKKLDELALQGEILQLERDIKFDPQLRELDMQRDKLRELQDAWDAINAAIREMEDSLDRLAGEAASKLADDARKAKEELEKAPKVGVAVEDFRAAGAGDFPVPGGTAPPGLGREGGLPEIEDFNKELEKELEAALDQMGSFDMFEPFKQMWRDAWNWIKKNVGPYVIPVWEAVRDFFSGIDWGSLISNPFSALEGVGGPIGKIFESLAEIFDSFLNIAKEVWSFLGEVFGPVFEWIGNQVSKAVDKIGGELSNWGSLFAPAIEAVTHIGNVIEWVFKYVITPAIVVAMGVILAIWNFTWPLLAGILTPIIDLIINVIVAGLQILRGIIGAVLHAINGDWGDAWNSILTILSGTWDLIYSVIAFPVKLIWGIIKGLVEGVIGFFKFLYNTLVGNSIIPDMMNAIVKWFNFLLDAIKSIWGLIWSAVKWAWDNIGLPIFNAIKWTIDNVLLPAFNLLLSGVKTVWKAIGAAINFTWDTVINPIWTAIKWTIDTLLIPAFKILRSGIETAWNFIRIAIRAAWETTLKPIWDTIIDFLKNTLLQAFKNFQTGLSDIWTAIKKAASSAWNGIVSGIRGAINIAIKVINALISGINAIGNLPGISINIAHIPELKASGTVDWSGLEASGLAAGGRVDPTASKVGSGFRTNRVRAIVGEGNPIYPEYVIPTDPTYRSRAKMLANSLANDLGMEIVPPQYAFGGILDTVGDAWDATGGKVATGIRKGAAMAAFAPFNAIADQLINLIPVDIVKKGARFAKDTVYNWVKGTDEKIPEAPQLGTGIGYQKMFAALKDRFPWAVLHSGFRPGAITATGNPSYHGMGRAVDVNPSMEMFNWILENYGLASKEIIFSPANQRQIRNGSPHMYTGVTRGDHWDHIHWAMAQGGIIPSLGNGGIVYPRPGGTLLRAGENGQREAVVPLPRDFTTGGKTMNFYGDLSFPNITSGDDAEELIRNLESLAD